MSFPDAFFEPHVLVFTIPVLLAGLFWLLSFAGLFDVTALDLDLDVDADADVALSAGSVPSLLGLGLVPLSILLTVMLFCFGWTGIALHALAGAHVAAWGWGAWTTTMLFVPVAAVVAISLGAGVARLLHPLFRDYGAAPSAHALVGRVAVLNSTTVSPTFGSAVVSLDGDRIEIAVRTDAPAAELGYGDRVLVYDYDAARNLYFVGRYDADEPARPSGS